MIKIFSAPIQGFTDCAWRNAHSAIFAGDIDNYYAPFLRIEKGGFRNKDLRDIEPEANTGYHLVPQVIACHPEHFALLVGKIASMGYSEIDINMGCPFSPIVKHRCGAGILPYPDEVKAMLEVAGDFLGITFSIKMRLGVDNPDEWISLMPILADFKPAHVTMHPRTARQQYGGNTDMEQFKHFYEIATFPVVYNGDVCSQSDISLIASEFPRLHAIMVGRGLLSNPALVSCNTIEDTPTRISDLHNRIFMYYQTHLCGDAHLLAKMKSLWEYFLVGQGDRKLRKKILKSTSIDKYIIAVDDFLSGYHNDM